MIVTVTSEDVELRDAGDLKRLHVSCAPTLPLTTIGLVLRRTETGYVDDVYAYLDIGALRRLREGHGFVNDAAFDQMVDYATKNEWISPDASAVRAHIVRTETPDSERPL